MARNQFIDPVTGEVYVWEVNEAEVESAGRQRTVNHLQPVAAAWEPVHAIRQQAEGGPNVRRFTGTVATRTQHEAFLRFWRTSARRTVHCLFCSGERFEVIVRSYEPQRTRVLTGPRGARGFLWRYTMELELLAAVT